jgi:hypothetical protein
MIESRKLLEIMPNKTSGEIMQLCMQNSGSILILNFGYQFNIASLSIQIVFLRSAPFHSTENLCQKTSATLYLRNYPRHR